MSSKRLKRTDVEALAALYGCCIDYKEVRYAPWNYQYRTYAIYGDEQEYIGDTPRTTKDFFNDWTNQRWVEVFQRITGKKTPDVWQRQGGAS